MPNLYDFNDNEKKGLLLGSLLSSALTAAVAGRKGQNVLDAVLGGALGGLGAYSLGTQGLVGIKQINQEEQRRQAKEARAEAQFPLELKGLEEDILNQPIKRDYLKAISSQIEQDLLRQPQPPKTLLSKSKAPVNKLLPRIVFDSLYTPTLKFPPGAGLTETPARNKYQEIYRPTVQPRRTLTKELALEYLRKTRGNLELAKEMAKRDGWEF